LTIVRRLTYPLPLLALVLLAASCTLEAQTKGGAAGVPRGLRECSVTVDGCGSGTLFVTRDGTYVLTANHVLDAAATHAKVVQVTPALDGRHKVVEVLAEVLNRSAAYDLALLGVGRGVWKTGATLHRGPPPKLDAGVWHVGSYLGKLHHSVAGGRVQWVGDTTHGQLLDRANFTLVPGSSGGGLFDAQGQLVGVVVRHTAFQVGYYVPSRCVLEWARKEEIGAIFE
jgi:S1-C subfamily serine protease